MRKSICWCRRRATTTKLPDDNFREYLPGARADPQPPITSTSDRRLRAFSIGRSPIRAVFPKPASKAGLVYLVVSYGRPSIARPHPLPSVRIFHPLIALLARCVSSARRLSRPTGDGRPRADGRTDSWAWAPAPATGSGPPAVARRPPQSAGRGFSCLCTPRSPRGAEGQCSCRFGFRPGPVYYARSDVTHRLGAPSGALRRSGGKLTVRASGPRH
jgi:hypothetical protein